MPTFGAASRAQLATCHPDLIRLFEDVVQSWDCTVLEGKRSEAQQRINVAHGVSKTLDSKHVYPLGVPSLAVDVAPYPVRWTDFPRFYAFAGFVVGTARKLNIPIRWGGSWSGDHEAIGHQAFNDLPHYELVNPGGA